MCEDTSKKHIVCVTHISFARFLCIVLVHQKSELDGSYTTVFLLILMGAKNLFSLVLECLRQVLAKTVARSEKCSDNECVVCS